MTTPIPESGHYIAIVREGLHHIVKCTCKWRAPGGYYHPKRAVMAGERHLEDVA